MSAFKFARNAKQVSVHNYNRTCGWIAHFQPHIELTWR